MRRLTLALLLACLAAALPARAAEPRADLIVDPKGPIGRQEMVQVTLKVSASGQLRLAPPVFRLENLQQVQGPSQTTSIQVVNGVMSQGISFTWLLQPRGVGPARIQPFSLRVGDSELAVAGADLEIVESAPPRADRRAQDPFGRLFGNDPLRDPLDDFFDPGRRRRPAAPARPPQILLEATVSNREPWLGQQLVYTLYLLTEVNVRSVSPTKVPDFKGFWNEVIPQPDNAEPEIVERDGRRMGRVVLLERALFPRQAGRIEVEPVEVTMTALLPDASSFGLIPIQRQVTRQSERVVVEVRPLPPAPAGYDALVGQVDLKAALDRAEVEVGQAATLTVTLQGRGHLQGVAAPELPDLKGLKTFPPQQSGSESIRNRMVSGQRVWSYVLVPERPGRLELPPIAIPYFDPQAGEFKTATAAGLALDVRGATETTAPSGERTVGLHPIRPNALPAELLRPTSRVRWPWALGLLALPWALLLLRAGWLRRRGAAGPAGLRQRIEARFAAAADEKRPRACAVILEEGWRAYLEERFGIAPGVASAQWKALLRERRVAPELADQLVALTEDLHYLRYAPELSSTDDLRLDLVERSRRLLKSFG